MNLLRLTQFRISGLVLVWVFFMTVDSIAQQKLSSEVPNESEQQISEFSLSGYGEKGKKTWDLSGKSADIFTDVVKLKDITANLYGKDEDIKLTADKGDFNKSDGKVHLEQNVVITTSSGTRLTTDSLDWDRKNQLVNTDARINIQRENMITTATGAIGQPDLNKITFNREVTVEILPVEQEKKNRDSKTVITCDGPMEVDYTKNIATLKDNVKVDRADSQIYSDIMDIYFSADKEESQETTSLMGSKIERIIAKGHVKIIRGENISYSDEAIYTALDKKITLLGRPKLILYSAEDLDTTF